MNEFLLHERRLVPSINSTARVFKVNRPFSVVGLFCSSALLLKMRRTLGTLNIGNGNQGRQVFREKKTSLGPRSSVGNRTSFGRPSSTSGRTSLANPRSATGR